MPPGFDDHRQREIYERARASLQADGDLDGIGRVLGEFRRMLIGQGFSTDIAEQMAREFFSFILHQVDEGETSG